MQVAQAKQTQITGSLVTLKLCVIREFVPSISNVHISELVTDISFKMATQLTIYGCSNVSTTLSESCENVIREGYLSVATTLSCNF